MFLFNLGNRNTKNNSASPARTFVVFIGQLGRKISVQVAKSNSVMGGLSSEMGLGEVISLSRHLLFFYSSVFDILLTFHETQDWPRALAAGIPPRKGLVLKE